MFSVLSSPRLLSLVLGFDALTCVAMGLLLSLFADALAGLLGLPPTLLLAAGLLLFPSAALMALGARSAPAPAALVWLVILGNAAWVLGSVLVCVYLPLTGLGQVFVLGQALAVAVLAELEYVGWRRLQTPQGWSDA